MFGIGGFELFIILLFGFLIFGPDKLPEMAKTLGAALRKFKQAQAEMESVIKGEVLDVGGTQGKKASSAGSSAASAKSKPAPTVTQESFAERKARYDKERAERKAREQKEAIEANRRAMKEEAAAKNVQAASVAQGTAASAADTTSATSEVAAVTPQSTKASATLTSQKPVLTPEELFGTKPIQNKPAPQSVAAATSASAPKAASSAASKPAAKAAPAAASERGE